MSLRIRHVLLRVETDAGGYGASIPFDDGLVVLHADNSKGKSTVVQAIVYALGLEGMFSTSHDVPLPHVMTHQVHDGTARHSVLTSSVSVEVENAKGERLVATREVKGGKHRHLISIQMGPALSTPDGDYPVEDKFVREPGAAQREAGFHHFFAKWIGWDLPMVQRFDGTEGPLYMECIFPLMIVEQKRGWSGIGARIPLQYRIREVTKRSIEFLLKLDVYEIVLKRQRLRETAESLKGRWRDKITDVEAVILSINGVIPGLPHIPAPSWDSLAQKTQISRQGGWVALVEAVSHDETQLHILEASTIPSADEIAPGTQEELNKAHTALASVETQLSTVFEAIRLERGQLENLDQRILTLGAEIQRNKDIEKLQRLGSELSIPQSDGTCPTCHQPLADSLLPLAATDALMSLADTIAYDESQRDTFKAVRDAIQPALQAKEQALASLRVEANDLRSHIRALKETLVSPASQPAISVIEQRVQLRNSISLFKKSIDRLDDLGEEISVISAEWMSNQKAIDALPDDDLSDSDRAKLKRLEELFIEQARDYGVTSLEPDSLAISNQDYKPIQRQGFELDFDLSASDTIRAQWAYLHGMLELSREAVTNHLGLLIFDEPRQQETAPRSLTSFLSRAASALEKHQQVIVSTSEQRTRLDAQLKNISHQFNGFDGHIVTKLG